MERLEGELARISGEFRTERAAARRTPDEIAASIRKRLDSAEAAQSSEEVGE